MDLVYYTILFSIIMIILNFIYFSVLIFDILIRIPFISKKPILVLPSVRKTIDGTIQKILNYGNPILILFIVFYILFYICYLLIKLVVPDTGIQTFFIPLKELLLKIPPLPSLEEYGVFRLFECIGDAFKISSSLKAYIKINNCFIDFSTDNIKAIIKLIFGDTEFIPMDEEKPTKKVTKKPVPETNKIHREIEEDVNNCYKNKRIPTRFGMTETERRKIEYQNENIYTKCKSNSIGKYIRII
jgi:hypothetical protein